MMGEDVFFSVVAPLTLLSDVCVCLSLGCNATVSLLLISVYVLCGHWQVIEMSPLHFPHCHAQCEGSFRNN